MGGSRACGRRGRRDLGRAAQPFRRRAAPSHELASFLPLSRVAPAALWLAALGISTATWESKLAASVTIFLCMFMNKDMGARGRTCRHCAGGIPFLHYVHTTGSVAFRCSRWKQYRATGSPGTAEQLVTVEAEPHFWRSPPLVHTDPRCSRCGCFHGQSVHSADKSPHLDIVDHPQLVQGGLTQPVGRGKSWEIQRLGRGRASAYQMDRHSSATVAVSPGPF